VAPALAGGSARAFTIPRTLGPPEGNQSLSMCVMRRMVQSTIFTRRARAKRRWLQEWDVWVAENISPGRRATEAEGFAFYTSRKNAPDLQYGGHKLWQSVRGWLLETGKL
jgi:hypothetical protein